MKDIIDRYISYGCSRKVPHIPKVEKLRASFEDIKEALLRIITRVVEDSVATHRHALYQCSGGLDSTTIISLTHDKLDIPIRTICTGDKKHNDIKFSQMVSTNYKTHHWTLDEKSIMKDVDIEKSLLEMNQYHNLPRGLTNDLGLFTFLKRVKEETDTIVGGEGVEMLYLGYPEMYSQSLLRAIRLKDYDSEYALELKKKSKRFTIDLDYSKIYKKVFGDWMSSINWWTTPFLPIIKEEIECSYFDFINLLYFWMGYDIYHTRKVEYAGNLGIKWLTPFMDDRFVNFSLSIPIEMRNCLGNYKFILYETLGHLVPGYVLNRPKEGLVLSSTFYESRYEEIKNIVKKYLKDPQAKIHEYLDIQGFINLFDHKYSFDALRKIWMLLNLEMWLRCNLWKRQY